MNRDTAREYAKMHGIKGYSRMKAPDLIKAVQEHKARNAKPVGRVPAGDLLVREADFRDPFDQRITFESDAERVAFFKVFR